MTETYVSTDIEADGPIPGIYSMLSFGSAAFAPEGQLIDTFTRNLETLEGAQKHEDTMNWWRKQPRAWNECRTNLVHPETAMREYLAWLKALPARPVFLGYPASFDQSFIHWYLVRFTGEDPMGFSGLDIKSYAMALLGTSFRATTKSAMPKQWRSAKRHTHVALDDAIEQGELFINMLRARANQP